MAKLNHSNLEDPVLSHMTREFIYLRDDQCVREAMEHCHCRGIAQHIIYFYVTDEQKRLIGVVPTRRLLMSKPDEKISSIMLREIVSVPIGANVQAACELFYKYRYLALPVVDEPLGRPDDYGVDRAFVEAGTYEIEAAGSGPKTFAAGGVQKQISMAFMQYRRRAYVRVCRGDV